MQINGNLWILKAILVGITEVTKHNPLNVLPGSFME